MIDVTPLRVEKTCFAQSCFGFSKQEIQFVLKFPGINHTQKLVWMLLASFAANDPDFARQLSCHQFARLLDMKVTSVWRVIKQLEVMGLVQVNKGEYFEPLTQRSLKYSLLNLLLKIFHLLVKIIKLLFRFIHKARLRQYYYFLT